MSINDFAEMTILLCLMFFHLCINFNQPVKVVGKCFLERVPDDSAHTLGPNNAHTLGPNILSNCSISHRFQQNFFFFFLHFIQKFKMAAKNGRK